MSTVGFPYFPISRMVECDLGTEKLEEDLRMTKWSKIPTQHVCAIYNGTAAISNGFMLATVALAIAIAVSYLHPVWGVIAFVASSWIYLSARKDCLVLSAKIRGILAEVHPIIGHFGTVERGCLCLTWQPVILPVPQDRLDALPRSFDALRTKVTLKDWKLRSEIRSAWLNVHERNRPCLRQFFNEKSDEYQGNDLGLFQLILSRRCLLNDGAREFFSEPKTRVAISIFLERFLDEPICDDEGE